MDRYSVIRRLIVVLIQVVLILAGFAVFCWFLSAVTGLPYHKATVISTVFFMVSTFLLIIIRKEKGVDE